VRLAVTPLEDRVTPATITAGTVSPAIEGSGLTLCTTGYARVYIDTPSSMPVIVLLAFSGTATHGSDFNASTSATIPAYATSVDVPISPVNNFTATGTLGVIMTVIPDWFNSYSIGSPSASTTDLFDADNPQVTVASVGGNPTEGGNGTFRITRTGSTSSSLNVNFTTGGSATSGTDYTIDTSATITAGNSYVDVTVTTLPDNLVEGAETVTITITDGGTDYTALPDTTASLTITDDPPVVSIARLSDGTEGGVNGAFRVSRTGGDISESLTAYYTFNATDSTATSGSDFTALSGSVTISAYATYADITVAVTDDGTFEPAETVIVTLDADDDYLIGSAEATLFIWDNDGTIYYWTGASDATWMSASNWLVGGVIPNDPPGASDSVHFTTTYATRDAELSGPIPGGYSVAEMVIVAGYSYSVDLLFPLSVASFNMAGGVIDQPGSGYGSDLTITGAAVWTGGTLNSTSNAGSVIFNGASVAIDGTANLETGSEIEFVNAAGAGSRGSVTFINGTTTYIIGSATVTFSGMDLLPSLSGTGGDLEVNGGNVTIFGGTTANSLFVRNGGTATIAGGKVSFTGTVPGSSSTSVHVMGGILNIQEGSTLDGGKNDIHVSGWDGTSPSAGELNTLPSDVTPSLEAKIKANKLYIGHGAGTVTVTINKSTVPPGNHLYGVLNVECPVEWHRASLRHWAGNTLPAGRLNHEAPLGKRF
jgi:hypothetical protein